MIIDKKKYHNLLFFYNEQIKVINNNLDVFDETILKHLYKILQTSKFDIILFGTGENLKKIPDKLKKYLIEQKHNFEIIHLATNGWDFKTEIELMKNEYLSKTKNNNIFQQIKQFIKCKLPQNFLNWVRKINHFLIQ